jgi:hypothetical protein
MLVLSDMLRPDLSGPITMGRILHVVDDRGGMTTLFPIVG